MLVLSRRIGEAIQIGADIELVVVAVRGDRVRLGIRAPRQVQVVRRELLEAVQGANLAAADSAHVLSDCAETGQEQQAGGRRRMLP